MQLLQGDIWLSEILGKPAFSFAYTPELVSLGVNHPGCRLLQTQAKQACLIYSKIPVHEPKACGILSALGFQLVDTNILFEKVVNHHASSSKHSRVRSVVPEDEEAVARIARHCFTFSRFHLDPHISRDTADSIKESWVRSFFRSERGEAMLVAEEDGELAGFVQLLKPAPSTLVIDLLGVAERFRRRSIAREMIACTETLAQLGGTVRVGTQLANVPSLRLYQDLGFRLIEARYVYHLHGPV